MADHVDGMLVGFGLRDRCSFLLANIFEPEVCLRGCCHLHQRQQYGKYVWTHRNVYFQITDCKGWRYIWYGNGALVFICSILRVTVIRLRETPKYLLIKGEDAAVVEIFQEIAKKYNRPCRLSVDELEALGTINSTYGKSRYGFGEFWAHICGLFATRTLAISTLMIWLSWLLIGTVITPRTGLFNMCTSKLVFLGLAYPLFYVFLPEYLATRGAQTGETGPYYQWRNYMLSSIAGIFGPVAAGFMCNFKLLGRKYTMAIGALTTMAFFFAYTAVRTQAQNVGLSCAIAFSLNIYYGTRKSF